MALTKEAIFCALTRLDEKLREKNVKGELCLVGGTVMLLAFNARPSTKDVDAIFHPVVFIREAAKEIQVEQTLPINWLNDAAKAFISAKHESAVEVVRIGLPKFNNLTVYWPQPEYLLAIKTMASRLQALKERGDLEDIKILIKHLGLKSPKEVFDIV